MNDVIRFDSVEYHNTTSAPWVSTELFVTGCYKRCPECFNKALQSFNGKKLLYDQIKLDFIEHVPYKKVTFSGGEPFLQAESLSYLAKGLRTEGFLIVCYSGYTADELPYLFPYAKDLLENIDILVDGAFIKELLTPIDKDFKFVGSSNQRIINIQKSLDEEKIILWTEEDTAKILAESSESQEEILRRYENG
jgi:anaerobic ribonucleoside-triphosphate reductase activating protein